MLKLFILHNIDPTMGQQEGYNLSLKDIDKFFDKEYIYRNDEKTGKLERHCILILSSKKLKHLGWFKHHKNINQLDQRITLTNYKELSEELCKHGIDASVEIVERLIGRHHEQSKKSQLNLILC